MAARPAAETDPSRDVGGNRFDERFLRRLESLVLTIRRSARMSGGLLRANRASKRVGAGLEFADHRDYTAGDDLRYLDWNLYGRLGRLALRLFQEEEDLDRKSTRLNSSHVAISYAVFCLKKKK